METLNFQMINEVALKTIDEELTPLEKEILTYLGEVWFYFKKEVLKECHVYIPFYELSLIKKTSIFLANLSYLLNLKEKEEIQDFNEEDFLFDFFRTKRKSNNQLQYNETKNEVSKWGGEVYTDNKSFLPVFNISSHQAQHYNVSEIRRDLSLFSEIRRQNFIPHPIRINFKKDFLILLNGNKNVSFKTNSRSLIMDYHISQSEDETDYQYDVIDKGKFKNQLIIRYPYYRRIDDDLIDLVENTFEINFQKRFYIEFNKEIQENELYCLPLEIRKPESPRFIINPNPKIQILYTNHKKEIRDLLLGIKYDWKQQNWSIYTHPFPKYFFMFITPEKNTEEWMEIFVASFPLIEHSEIYFKIQNLISLLIDLNWVDIFFNKYENKEDIHFVFPSLVDNNKGQSKRLREAYQLFKRYCMKKSDKISFGSSLSKDVKNFLLNGFDSLKMVNHLQTEEKPNYSYLFTDFSYFNLNPFISLHVFDLQAKAYTSKFREGLLSNYDKINTDIEEEREELKSELIKSFNRYKNFYKIEVESDEILEEDEFFVEPEDIDIDDDEETIKHQFSAERYNITCLTGENELILDSHQNVYVLRQNFIRIPASDLIKGDFILNETSFSIDIVNETLFQNLETIPDSVKYFKYELNKIPNVFERLKNKGLNIEGRYYFNTTYLSDKREFKPKEFRLPRKEDWTLICEFLDISSKDKNLGYVARYKSKSQIKNLYLQLLKYLFENQELANIAAPHVQENLLAIVAQYDRLFKSEDDTYDLDEFTNSIVMNIKNEVENYFEEIIKLKRD